MNDYLKKRMEHINNGRPLQKKERKPIAKVSKKRAEKLAAEREARGDGAEDKYFDYWMKNAVPRCEECGMEAPWLLEPQYSVMWRACQAHVLPKKKKYGFPSLRDNLDNHMVLFPSFGGHLCGDHGFFDSSWFNATTMNVWPKAVEIFKKLYPLIPENERKNIPEQLLKELQ